MKARILFVAPQVPWPLTNGLNIRMFYLLANYARYGDVHLAAFYQHPDHVEAAEALRPYCKEISLFSSRGCRDFRQSRRALVRRSRKLFRLRPYSFYLHYSEQKAAWLREASIAQYDLVHISQLNSASVFLSACGRVPTRTVFDLNDVESLKLGRRLAGRPFSRRKVFEYLELLRLAGYEQWAIPCFDYTLVCSEVDRRRLTRRGIGSRVVVVPNGVNLECFTPTSDTERPGEMLYLGSLHYPPNVQAIRHFHADIFPLVKARVPEARLVIAGSQPPSEILSLHNGRDVVVAGFVPKAEEALAHCAVFVVPLRVGGGTRIKILEAMAMARPVVSTSIGCEGLDVRDGEHLFIEDDPARFADRCVQLLQDERLRRYLGANGRRLVEARYDWRMTLRPLTEILELGQ